MELHHGRGIRARTTDIGRARVKTGLPPVHVDVDYVLFDATDVQLVYSALGRLIIPRFASMERRP